MSNFTIRPFTDGDYKEFNAISQTVYPDWPVSVKEQRDWDLRRRPELFYRRLLAEVDGNIAGYIEGGRPSWADHPGLLYWDMIVLPAFERRGIGTALYERFLMESAGERPTRITTAAREDDVKGIRFITKRGYVEEMRSWESRLNVGTFDFSPYKGHIEKVLAQGIDIRTYAELAGDPERDRKLYDLDVELTHEMPSPDPYTPPTFERYRETYISHRNFLPDGLFFALDGDRFIGMSALWANDSGEFLNTGTTGVRREYRRRGIAMALKLRAIAYARNVGCAEIRTSNASNNRPMLSINERFGFVKQPELILYALTIDRPADETGIANR